MQLITFPDDASALDASIAQAIFIRHCFPVQLSTPIDTPKLSQTMADLCAQFPKDKPFSIQMRCTDQANKPQALSLIKETEAILQDEGYIKDDANPSWAISLVIDDNKAVYVGVSFTSQNLSTWNGGMHRFKRDDSYISRAEFKLLEALSVFSIDIPALGAKTALDLGAAPGGWTKILLDRGLHVTAVDPANLSETLQGNSRLEHIQDIAQRLITKTSKGAKIKKDPFDILVNDMRMDMMESCKIMLDMTPLLAHAGIAVMTFKLPHAQWYKNTKRALALLEKSYTVQGARQLFHNRSEVTVWLSIK